MRVGSFFMEPIRHETPEPEFILIGRDRTGPDRLRRCRAFPFRVRPLRDLAQVPRVTPAILAMSANPQANP